ncbi:MAG: TPM domain-containing protein [Burkholderiaceae bacterium]
MRGFSCWCRHLVHDGWLVRRYFPDTLMDHVERAVSEGEAGHSAEIRVAIEASLPLRELWRGCTARERALQVFAELGVWDTEANNGVLLYVLLAERAVEIVADRAASAAIDTATWSGICESVARTCRTGRFEEGLLAGVAEMNRVLTVAFPARGGDRDELPNRPAIL